MLMIPNNTYISSVLSTLHIALRIPDKDWAVPFLHRGLHPSFYPKKNVYGSIRFAQLLAGLTGL